MQLGNVCRFRDTYFPTQNAKYKLSGLHSDWFGIVFLAIWGIHSLLFLPSILQHRATYIRSDTDSMYEIHLLIEQNDKTTEKSSLKFYSKDMHTVNTHSLIYIIHTHTPETKHHNNLLGFRNVSDFCWLTIAITIYKNCIIIYLQYRTHSIDIVTDIQLLGQLYLLTNYVYIHTQYFYYTFPLEREENFHHVSKVFHIKLNKVGLCQKIMKIVLFSCLKVHFIITIAAS